MGRFVVAMVGAAAWFAAAEGKAQIHVGPQLGLGSDSDLGVGARVVFPLRVGLLGADGAIDGNYFFGPGGVNSWIDTNANVRFPVPFARDFNTRIGAGLNLTYVSIDVAGSAMSDSETDVGLNLLGLFELPRGRTTPFGEVRAIVGGGEQFVFTFGVLFGPPRETSEQANPAR